MKRYSNYRDSSLAFVEKIPQHWDVKRAKNFFYEIDERSEKGDEELLSVSHITGVTPRSEKNITMFMAESYEGYKTCIPNDLVINIMWAWMGALGVSKYQGIISSAYGVYRQKNKNNFYTDYLEYLVRIPEYIAEYMRRSKGIRSSRLRMYSDDFFQIPIICPPIEEQKQIAYFLDRKLEQIDHFISNKQRLIELLKEQKTAIINRAFTKGLNPHARMKYSGIELIGEIPAHWEFIPIKRCLKSYDYGLSDNIKGEGTFKVLTMGHIQDGQIIVPEQGSLENVPEELILDYGDLLFNRTNSPDLVGKVGIFQGHKEDKVTFASYLVRLKPNEYTDSVYLNFLLNSHFILSKARQQALVSLHQANLNATKYSRLLIYLPPIEEQREIVNFIKVESAKVDLAIAKIQKEIELIQEYRTTLISDAVTGKIDVPEPSAVEPTLTAAAI